MKVHNKGFPSKKYAVDGNILYLFGHFSEKENQPAVSLVECLNTPMSDNNLAAKDAESLSSPKTRKVNTLEQQKLLISAKMNKIADEILLQANLASELIRHEVRHKFDFR